MTPDRIYSVTSSRLKLNITEWGDPAAPPLVLQHGGRDHARSWDAVVAAFVGEYRVIAPDLRGHGDSEWANDGDYQPMDFAYDFANIVDALDLPPCPMIGHSLGGSIMMRFAALYPHRVTRFINIEGLGLSPRKRAEIDARDKGEVFRDWFETRRRMHGWTPKSYQGIAAVAARLLEQDPRLSQELVEHLAREATRPNADGSVSMKYDPAFNGQTVIDISEDTRHELWQQVSCPILFVYGAQSFASNPMTDGRMAWFSDARLEMFENAGHWVHHDRHDAFIALAREFLAS